MILYVKGLTPAGWKKTKGEILDWNEECDISLPLSLAGIFPPHSPKVTSIPYLKFPRKELTTVCDKVKNYY